MPLAGARAADAQLAPPPSRSRSNACIGWPDLEQHVVGDVDDVVDRPHAGGRRAGRPARRAMARRAPRRPRPRTAGRGRAPRSSTLEAVGDDRPASAAARRTVPPAAPAPRRQAQRQVAGGGRLAGEADDAQAVGPVRRDLEVDHRRRPAGRRDRLATRSTPPRSRAARACDASVGDGHGGRPRTHGARKRGVSKGELLQEAQVVLVEQPDVVDAGTSASRRARCPCRRRSRCSAPGRSRPPRRPPGAPCRCRGSRASRCACRPGSRAPPQKTQPMNTSALGSVYGKKLGRKQHRACPARTARARTPMSVPFRSAIVTPSPTTQPLELVEHRRVGEVEVVAAVHPAEGDDPDRRLVRLHVADLHRRGVRPQQRGRPIGRPAACVSSAPGVPRPRAGPSAGRGTACPACRAPGARAACSAPRSCGSRPRPRGPRGSRSPSGVKIASIWSRTIVSGWRRPSAGRRPGSVTSTAPAGGRPASRAARAVVERGLDLVLQLVGELAEARAGRPARRRPRPSSATRRRRPCGAR